MKVTKNDQLDRTQHCPHKMGVPSFRLIAPQVSHDTVQVLEQLLDHARSGQLIGVAFAAMYRERRYSVSTTGEAERNPTFTLGMLRALDFKLSSKVGRGR